MDDRVLEAHANMAAALLAFERTTELLTSPREDFDRKAALAEIVWANWRAKVSPFSRVNDG